MELDARMLQVKSAISHGQIRRAKELVLKIVEDFPLAEEPLLFLADLVDKPQDAIDVLNRATIINPNNGETCLKILRFKQLRDRQLIETPSESKAIPRKKVACPKCGVVVFAKNLQKHIKKSHGTKNVKTYPPAARPLNNPANKKRRTRKSSSESVSVYAYSGGAPGLGKRS